MKTTTEPPDDREAFLESPTCRDCNISMSLKADCEWPDDPRLWLCDGCAQAVLEQALVTEECLQRELDLKTHVLDQYEKEALVTLAELEKVTRDAAELLEALKAANAAMSTAMDHCYSDGMVHHQSFDTDKIGAAILTVRQAIAKAEGGAL